MTYLKDDWNNHDQCPWCGGMIKINIKVFWPPDNDIEVSKA